MAEVFNVEGKLGLDIASFKSKMGAASKNLNSFKMKAKRMAKTVKHSFKGVSVAVGQAASAIKVMAVAGAAGVTALVKTQLDYQDALAKSADKIGTNSKALSGLRYAAEQVSGGYEGIDEALTKATKRLGEFNANGAGASAKWLQKLNFDTAELAKLDPAELFNTYSAAISKLPSRAEKLAAASALMGDESRKFLTLMEQGPAAIRAYAQEAEQLGIAISRVDAMKIEAANDAMNRITVAFKGAGATLAVELAPMIKATSDKIVDMIKGLDLTSGTMTKFIDKGVRGIGFVIDAWHGFGVAMQGAKVIALGFSSAFTGVMSGTLKLAAKFGNAIKDFVLAPLRKMLELASKLPLVGDKVKEALGKIEGLKFKAPEIATEVFEGQVTKLVAAKEVLKQKLMEPMPSAGLTQWVDDIKVASENTAKLWEAETEARKKRDEAISASAANAAALRESEKAAQLEHLKTMEAAADTFGGQMRSTLGSEISGVLNGEFDNIGDAFKSMLKNMVAQAIAADIANAIGLGGAGAGGTGGSGFFAGAGQFVSGFFAEGGNPPMNKAAVVGEDGPEVFVPRQAGTVIPNDQLGGGGSSIVNNFSISTPDAQSFRSSRSKIANELSRSMR